MQLTTDRLLLRELEEHDAAAANEYERDADTVRYVTHPTRTLAESLDYIRGGLAERHRVPRRVFDLAIVRRSDDRMIGRVGGRLGDDGELEVWYILHAIARGQGYAVEACRAFIEAAFRDTTARAIVADIDPRNHASIAVAERLGLSRERLIVGNVTIKGELCDTLIMRLDRPT